MKPGCTGTRCQVVAVTPCLLLLCRHGHSHGHVHGHGHGHGHSHKQSDAVLCVLRVGKFFPQLGAYIATRDTCDSGAVSSALVKVRSS
jgi:hypothetical protein